MMIKKVFLGIFSKVFFYDFIIFNFYYVENAKQKLIVMHGDHSSQLDHNVRIHPNEAPILAA